jgi:hypothetical protein
MAKTTPSAKPKTKAPKKKAPTELEKRVTSLEIRLAAGVKIREEHDGRLNVLERRLPQIMEDGAGGFVAKLTDGSTVVHTSPFKLASPTVAVEEVKPLKAGDWVVCLEDIGGLEMDRLYMVRRADGFIYVQGILGGWYPDRFRSATPEEIAAHEAKGKADAQAAEDARLVFGARVLCDNSPWRIACDMPLADKWRLVPDKNTGSAMWVRRNEFTLID